MTPATLTRDELARIYEVSQGYLGYMLREKKVPLPVRINGEILWYADEVQSSYAKVKAHLERKRKVN